MKKTYLVAEHFDSISGGELHEFEKAINALVNDDFTELEIDFDGIQYITSFMIGCLIRLADDVAKKGAELRLVNLTDQIKWLLNMAGLDKVIVAGPEDTDDGNE